MTSSRYGAPGELIRRAPDKAPDAPQALAERVAAATLYGDRLRLARELAGLSLEQAARMIGLPVAELSAAEASMRALTVYWTEATADVYGVSIRWLETGALEPHDLPDTAPADACALAGILRPTGAP